MDNDSKNSRPMTIRVPALEIRQTPERRLFAFAIDGKDLPSVAAVSRVRRDDAYSLQGYQRPEVLSHITEIRKYIESNDPILPNAIVVAFDGTVTFEVNGRQDRSGTVGRQGRLVIPVPNGDERQKPGWVVDGQQRMAAIRGADVETFPVFVVAFMARDDEDQREQFILVNATKPLPKGLVYELLPVTQTRLPANLVKRKLPAGLSERLNFDCDSPFEGIIRTPTCPNGVIKDNSILKMLENSLSDGILYWLRTPQCEDGGDLDRMLKVVKEFWWAIRGVFPDAWGKTPRRSRLMHGAGIVSLGMLMDAIAEGHRRVGLPDRERFTEEIHPVKGICAWTCGHWEFRNGERRRWNEIQNTAKDIKLLSDHLLREYQRTVVAPYL